MRTLDQFGKDLNRAAKGGLLRVVRQALVPFSQSMARTAKQNATVAPRVRTGALRNSIRGRVLMGPADVTLQVGASVRYARAQELGGSWFIRPWGRGQKRLITLRGKRYLGKAFDAQAPRARAVVTLAVKSYLETGIGGAGGN